MSFIHRTAGVAREDAHRHETVAEARECEDLSAQAAAEIWAEGAWLRAAEAGSPETWREEEIDRMTEALGYGPPPSMYF